MHFSVDLSFFLRRTLAQAAWLVLLVSGLVLSGCAQTGQMRDQARYEPMEASDLFANGASARVPPAGVVPYSPDISPSDPSLTGLDDGGQPLESIPVEVNLALVARGQERYDIFCIPCHGPAGEGNGRVTGFGFPKPPSLLAEQAKGLPAGRIFDIIANGQGTMFPYRYRVNPADRWAVIAYIRALQLRDGAVTLDELTPEELNQIGGQP